MPNHPKDHAAMQRSVCAVCFKKPQTLRNISASVKIQIKEFCQFDQFDADEWSWLPAVICGGCYKGLADIGKNSRLC